MKRIFWILSLCLWVNPVWACQTISGYGASLQQAWPEEDRATWYGLSQGSRLIPETWVRAVRLSDQQTAFADAANLQSYGAERCEGADWPVGFVIDQDGTRPPALGLTCAACHTGTITDGNNRFLVEGGQGNLDVQRLTQDLFDGMLAVFRDGPPVAGPVWETFAGQVLGDGHSSQQALTLHQDVAAWLEKRYRIQQSIQDGGDWGHGRIDAVGVIFNTVTQLSDPRAGQRLPVASAPTNYPHIWNAPQLRRVQWNGSARKNRNIGLFDDIDTGALVRNAAEVLGVFAELELSSGAINDSGAYPNIRSSVRMANLVELERAMATLKSPAWPDIWGQTDPDSPAFLNGARLYGENCASCHSLLPRDDLTTVVEEAPLGLDSPVPVVRMVPIFDRDAPERQILGTGPLMACNVLSHNSWSGKFSTLHNTYDSILKATKDGDLSALRPDKFPPEVSTLRLIEEMAIRMIVEKRGEIRAVQRRDLKEGAEQFLESFIDGVFGRDPGRQVDPSIAPRTPFPSTHSMRDLDEIRALCAERAVAETAQTGRDAGPAYKARPLNGVWATAPFLHNGSVPSLADLLAPPEARPTEFATGAVLYDRDKMGLGVASGEGPTSRFRLYDAEGRVIPGNFNGGHDYRPSAACYDNPMSDECLADTRDLLNYLKTL